MKTWNIAGKQDHFHDAGSSIHSNCVEKSNQDMLQNFSLCIPVKKVIGLEQHKNVHFKDSVCVSVSVFISV